MPIRPTMPTRSRPAPLRTKDLCYIALMAVLMSVCAWIFIPGPVPFTLQTFAVFFTLLTLGGRRGLFAICVYLLMGAAGLPVFTGGQGGMGVLMGATGGYIMGFILIGIMYRGIEDETSQIRSVAALVAGLIVCYAFGTYWYLEVYAQSSGSIGIGSALMACVVPFLLPDALKLALAVTLSKRMKKHLK